MCALSLVTALALYWRRLRSKHTCSSSCNSGVHQAPPHKFPITEKRQSWGSSIEVRLVCGLPGAGDSASTLVKAAAEVAPRPSPVTGRRSGAGVSPTDLLGEGETEAAWA